MRGWRSLSIASVLALFAQIGPAASAGAAAKVAAISTTDQTAEFGIWLPVILVLALGLMTIPALLPGLFGQLDRRL